MTNNNEKETASIDAKQLAVGPNGKPLDGEHLRVFTENVRKLESVMKHVSMSSWRIGDLLHETRPMVSKKHYRRLLKVLGISPSSAGRYQLLRKAWPSEGDVPTLGAMDLYSEARKIVPADESKKHAPQADPAVTLANAVLAKLSELVQRITDMGREQRDALSPTLTEILSRAERLTGLVPSCAALSLVSKRKATRSPAAGRTFNYRGPWWDQMRPVGPVPVQASSEEIG